MVRNVVQRQSMPEQYHAFDGHPSADDDDAILADLMAEVNNPHLLDNLADQVAAELERDMAAMVAQDERLAKPVTHDGRSRPAYDAWDDASLNEYFSDSDLAEFEPAIVSPEDRFHDVAGDEARPRRQRRLILFGSVAAVLMIGGGALFWAFGGGSTGFGEVRLVRAPEGPYKVLPDPNQSQAAGPSEGEAVFNSVGGVPPKNEERILPRDTEVPELPSVTPQVSRVTLPDGQEVEAELPSGFDPGDTGPRRVRSVSVRPDGTLIENTDSAPGASTARPIVAPPEAAEATAQALPEDDTSAAGLPPLAPSEQVQPDVPPAPLIPTPVQSDTVQTASAAQPGVVDAPKPPVRPAAPRPTAAAPSSGPLDLASAAQSKPQATPPAVATAAPAAAVPPAATPGATPGATSGGSFPAYVQVSSQRSEEAALSAFRALQKKFPGVLGRETAEVQKADLGAKGIYYRARVGRPSRAEAATLCEALKAAGGDCLLAK